MQSSVTKGHYRLLATSAGRTCTEHMQRGVMTMGSRVDTREGVKRGPTQNKMNVICGRGNARQRGSEHIEVLKSNHSQGSEHRQSREMEEPDQESGIQGTSRWARPTEVVSAVRHWMTINFHLIGFIWNSYFSFSLPLILSSISISITLPRWLSLVPSLLVALLHDCCGFYSSRVALAPNSLFPFRFYCF